MNLVAKEYVAARGDLGGALVLSEFAGAAAELKQAFLVNPHDIAGREEPAGAGAADRARRGRQADAGDAPAPVQERPRPLGAARSSTRCAARRPGSPPAARPAGPRRRCRATGAGPRDDARCPPDLDAALAALAGRAAAADRQRLRRRAGPAASTTRRRPVPEPGVAEVLARLAAVDGVTVALVSGRGVADLRTTSGLTGALPLGRQPRRGVRRAADRRARRPARRAGRPPGAARRRRRRRPAGDQAGERRRARPAGPRPRRRPPRCWSRSRALADSSLTLKPGKDVLELAVTDADKGTALRRLVGELGARRRDLPRRRRHRRGRLPRPGRRTTSPSRSARARPTPAYRVADSAGAARASLRAAGRPARLTRRRACRAVRRRVTDGPGRPVTCAPDVDNSGARPTATCAFSDRPPELRGSVVPSGLSTNGRRRCALTRVYTSRLAMTVEHVSAIPVRWSHNNYGVPTRSSGHFPSSRTVPVTLHCPLPRRPRRAGWFANRPLAVKFGVLIGVVVLAFGGVLGSMLIGNADGARGRATELANLNARRDAGPPARHPRQRAQGRRLQGHRPREPGRAARRAGRRHRHPARPCSPSSRRSRSTGASADAVAGLADSFGAYTDAISAFVDARGGRPGGHARCAGRRSRPPTT